MRKLCKKVISYWWDMEGSNLIVVESDHKDFPVVAKFKYSLMHGNGKIRDFEGRKFRQGCAEDAIKLAEEYIKKLNKGQIIPKAIKV